MFHEPRFWTSLALILFFVIFGRKLWRIVAAILDQRAEGIKNQLDEATRLRREAEQILENATRERDNARIEAQNLIAASEAEAKALKEQATRDTAEARAHHEKLARDRIAAAEQAALREIRDRAAALTVAATRDVLAEKLRQDPELAGKLITQGLDSLPTALDSASPHHRAA